MKKIFMKLRNYFTTERLNHIFIIAITMFMIISTVCICILKDKNDKLETRLRTTEELCDSLFLMIDDNQIEISEMRYDNWVAISELDKKLAAAEEKIAALESEEKEEKKTEKTEKKTEKTETKTEKKEETVKKSSGTYTATITHYCACSKCNGSYSWIENGVNHSATASGLTLYDGLAGNYCAATFGSLGDVVSINGVDYKIVDRMGGNDGYRIDIFVSEGHTKCNELGRYKAEVTLKG